MKNILKSFKISLMKKHIEKNIAKNIKLDTKLKTLNSKMRLK